MDPEWTEAKLSLFEGHHCFFYDWGVLVDGEHLFYPSSASNKISEYLQLPPSRQPVVVFTDGSGTTSKKNAGIGVVVYERGSAPLYIAENIGAGTNNVAELRAIWRVLKQFPDRNRELRIYSDSEYAIGSLTLNWSPQANEQLIRHMREDLSLRPNIRIEHVKGHEGHEGNEIADRLANVGRTLVSVVSL